MSDESFGLVGVLGDLAGLHPIVASVVWFVVGGAVGAGGAWAYSDGSASTTRIEVSAIVSGLIIGCFGTAVSWAVRRQYIRQSGQVRD